ncbi:MAG: DNA mismatch repair protein MutS [Syntrophomonadaceae bacterium]|nr:DNA mismatch repair protein MutS [Syntrophomonadaceae bacterium]
MPEFFADLNLDQLVESICARRSEYHLQPFYYVALGDIAAIEYSQAIMRDLAKEPVRQAIEDFAQQMRTVRQYQAQAGKLHYKLQQQRWFVDGVALYCRSVLDLVKNLSSAEPVSAGLSAFREYIDAYAESEAFRRMQAETDQLVADLTTIIYCLRIDDTRWSRKNGVCIQILPYDQESDYSAEVQNIFAKFQQAAGQDYRVAFAEHADMNHVEAGILEQVARMNHSVFERMAQCCENYELFMDAKIGSFDREIQFYLAYMDLISPLKNNGFPFCQPQLVHKKDICNHGGFDLALALKLHKSGGRLVTNDFYLHDQERILVVTGPNQGGKTTFARAFGQMHYLASLGLPVPGKDAQLFMFDQIFTHFEKEESITDLVGKLQDDLKRMHAILDKASPASIIILNEIFTSTTLQDAVFLSQRIMSQILQRDLLGVWVTFIDELASFSPATVSMSSTVVPENPAQRTYEILRQPADGLSYALSLAEKYRLTYTALRERIQNERFSDA